MDRRGECLNHIEFKDLFLTEPRSEHNHMHSTEEGHNMWFRKLHKAQYCEIFIGKIFSFYINVKGLFATMSFIYRISVSDLAVTVQFVLKTSLKTLPFYNL